MHEKFWAGVELKFQHAEFHLEQMQKSIEPPELTTMYVARLHAGKITDTRWQRSLYAHFDAFLLTVRCIPEIIQCCFGEDKSFLMKDWFDSLPEEEKHRRQEFRKQFDPNYKAFRVLPLSEARNVSVHRTGVPPVEVSITGRLGVTYIGNPVAHIPCSETRQVSDPALSWLIKPVPLPQPTQDDLTIDGRPLFPECQSYLKAARALIEEARRVSDAVHGNEDLTAPII
jgi:hypothetical protein